jgi:hypothetical protein
MHWLLMGPVGTKITLTFSDYDSGTDHCKGNPFDPSDPNPSGEITARTDHKFDDIVRKVKGDANGCFYYTFTCSNWTLGQAQSAKTDPIIDVPPKP